ncbi:MAG: AsmA-like C-terminal region-containing protein [Hyphomicrobium sp.]
MPYADPRQGAATAARRTAGGPATRKKRGPTRYVRSMARMALYAAPLVLLVAVAGVVGYVKLKHGDMSLKSFVAPIERGISEGLGGINANIADARLKFSDDGDLAIELVNLELVAEDGSQIASAPTAEVELSLGSLLWFQIVPERVFLRDPKLDLSYTDAKGLALSFPDVQAGPPSVAADVGTEGNAGNDVASRKVSGQPAAAAPPGAAEEPRATIDLARWFTEQSARARRGEDATSGLREVGVKNAVVQLDYKGRRSEWQVVEASVDLEHRKRRSRISGSARIIGQRGPWALSFQSEDSERSGTLALSAMVRDLVPSTLVKAFPELTALAAIDVPVDSDVSLNVGSEGTISAAKIEMALGAGRIGVPGTAGGPARVDAGRLQIDYDGAKRTLTLAPSTLKSGLSQMTLVGRAMAVEAGSGGPWRFDVQSQNGVVVAEDFGGTPIQTALVAAGTLVPATGSLRLDKAVLKAGDAEATVSGNISPGAAGMVSEFEGKLGAMPLETLKALWPRGIAPAARDWIGRRVVRGKVQSGTLRMAFGGETASAATPSVDRTSLAIELADLQAVPETGAVPVDIPRALVRLENAALEVTVPEATLTAGPQLQVAIKNGRFTAVDLSGREPVAEVAFKLTSTLPTAIAVAARPPFAVSQMSDLPLDGLEGKIEGTFSIKLPLAPDRALSGVKVEGKTRITDIRLKKKISGVELQGGTIALDIGEQAADVSGDLLLNGVIATVGWQHIFDAGPGQQPPLRIKATLDNSDRTQLGLDVNHIVHGDVPVEVTVAPSVTADALPAIHVRADLTGAELEFRDIAWRKEPGRAAMLDFDVGKAKTGLFELQNLKIAGDTIAVEGWASVNENNDLGEFYFPDFSLNTVSRLEAQGKLGPDKVWRIKAKGSTHDARDFFSSLFSLAGSDAQRVKPLRPAAGVDLEADVANVLGHNEVSIRKLKLRVSERAEKLTSLSIEGVLDGGKPLLALLRKEADGARTLYAESSDAGQGFKLIGFYRSVVGGRARLEVNLDGKGAADKTGVLWVDNFRVLGDPVVTEVIAGAGGGVGDTPGGQRVVREVYDFDRMRVPFSAGHDQFVLEDSYVRGAVVGATINGKVDFRSRRLNLGGTYIPLQGINSALCAIPLIGIIVTGPKCEGVLGLTFAVQGSMDQPQVLVNPLSMFTPGILRDIMQMTNPNQKVQAREDRRGKAPSAARTGNSSSEPVRASDTPGTASGSKAARDSGETIDGWSSVPSPGKK